MDSVPLGDHPPQTARVLDIHELAAGKLCALFARTAARDVFDSVLLMQDSRIDTERLRLGFVIYGAMSRRDWREVAISDLNLAARQFAREVSVLLRNSDAFDPLQLLAECHELVDNFLLLLRANEIKFLTLLNTRGVIAPELLTTDSDLGARLLQHPALAWKADNVRKFSGL